MEIISLTTITTAIHSWCDGKSAYLTVNIIIKMHSVIFIFNHLFNNEKDTENNSTAIKKIE